MPLSAICELILTKGFYHRILCQINNCYIKSLTNAAIPPQWILKFVYWYLAFTLKINPMNLHRPELRSISMNSKFYFPQSLYYFVLRELPSRSLTSTRFQKLKFHIARLRISHSRNKFSKNLRHFANPLN